MGTTNCRFAGGTTAVFNWRFCTPATNMCRSVPQAGHATWTGCSNTTAVLPIPGEKRIDCGSRSNSTGVPQVTHGGVGFIRWLSGFEVDCLREFLPIALAFFLEDLEATHLL